MIDMKTFLSLTYRARAALAIAMVEPLLADLESGTPGFGIAERAMAMATGWIAGEIVSADDLNDLLLDKDDVGLFALVDHRAPKLTDTAYTAIGGAISYVAWHAYRSEDLILPEGIEAVTEDFIEWIYSEASKSESFAVDFVTRFLEYLRANYRCESDCLGVPLNYYEAKAAC